MTGENDVEHAISVSSHSEESFKDEESVSFVKTILTKHRRVMPKIDSQDRWPNIDGFLELQDDKNALFGMLLTQVKTLPKNHNLKYDCPVTLFSYSDTTATLPVIFLGVDNANKTIYWLHFSKEFVKASGYRENKNTKIIALDQNKIITEEDKTYIDEWMKIIKEHKEKIENSEILIKENERIKMLLIEREGQSNPAINRSSQDFVLIHLFLDKLNYELDDNFPIVKMRMFSNLWKLGFAYHQFNETSLSYSFYPIQMNKNDVQIKEITENLNQEILSKGYGLTSHYAGNPIKENPENYALNIVQEKVFELLELKALNHKSNHFLLNEFVIAFIDKFYIQLGLESNDKYALGDVKSAFGKYLPLWIDEALKDNKIIIGRMNYIDPDILLSQMDEPKRKAIDNKVRKRISEGDLNTRTFTLGNRKFLMRVFVESLNYLEEMGIDEVNRIYAKKEFDRTKEAKSSWIWNVYSKDSLEKNLKIIFKNLSIVYECIIEKNFTNLKEDLSFFKDFNRLIVIFDAKDKYEEMHDSPSISYYYIIDESLTSPRIDIFREEDIEIKENFENGISIEFKGKKYKVITMSHGVLDFIFDDLPMLDFVYKLIEERLKKYFDKQIK